jgi:CubicO group peptidase (beta-lactamase class C family)
LFLTIVALMLAAPPLRGRQANGESRFPQKNWDRIENPASVGFSPKRLAALREWVQTLDTTALFVSVGGKELFEYGDVAHLSYLASARKSVLALLYGKYVDDGTIALDRTLNDLQFTDVGGLLPRELEATVANLLTARSGVYHPASNGGDDLARAPARGSQRPGAHFLYNNWDFNAAGAIFEQLTKRDIYDALESDLAKPIQMEDFDRARQQKNGNARASQHLAYPIWLSVRDMARVGLLALRGGRWNDRQIVPGHWIRKTTSLVTSHAEMNTPLDESPASADRWGYGYLWWVWDAPNAPGPFTGAFTAWGVGGQYITVLPALDIVVAHKVDTQTPRADGARAPNVTSAQYHALLRMLIAARCDRDCR